MTNAAIIPDHSTPRSNIISINQSTTRRTGPYLEQPRISLEDIIRDTLASWHASER